MRSLTAALLLALAPLLAGAQSADAPEEAAKTARYALDQALGDPSLSATTHADLLDNLGKAEFRAGRYADAAASYREAVAVRESTGNLSDPSISRSLSGLALSLLVQGKAHDAEPLSIRAIDLLEHAGLDHFDDLAAALFTRANVAIALGKYEEADKATLRMSALTKMLAGENGDAQPPTQTPQTTEEILRSNLDQLAAIPDMEFNLRFIVQLERGLLTEENDPVKAEREYGEAAADARRLGEGSVEAGCAANALAGFWRERGRIADAERGYREAARILAAYQPAFAFDLALAKLGIARTVAASNRPAEAQAAYEDAICALQASLTPNHPFVAFAQWDLAALAGSSLSQRERSELSRSAVEVFQSTAPFTEVRRLPPRTQHDAISGSVRLQEASDCATRLYQDALRSGAIPIASNNTALADSLSQSAKLYLGAGGYSQAAAVLPQVIALRRRAFGNEYALEVADLQQLADAERGTRSFTSALAHARDATALVDRRITTHRDPREALDARKFARGVYLTHLQVLLEANPEGVPRDAAEESFVIGQKARASATALTIESTAARFAASNTSLMKLVRRFEDLSDERRKLDADLLRSQGAPPEARDLSNEALLHERLRNDDTTLATLRRRIEQSYPKYAELVFAPPVSLSSIQKLLGRNEAMLAYVTGPRATFAWLVRHNRLETIRVDMTSADIRDGVASLRRGLQVDTVLTARASGQALPEFDLPAAWWLYRNLVRPFEATLHGVTHLFVVADGALESLPFGVLVTSEPKNVPSVSDVSWLGARIALSVLPAVSSLVSVRRTASIAQRPFIGFGQARSAPSAGLKNDESRLDRMRALRRLGDLTETRTELVAIAAAFHAPPDAVRLGDNATKAAILAAPLAEYRVISFSTHALVAGEAGAIEPSLIVGGSDGKPDRLTAQEIAAMKLDAEMVLLLGCNTAAADGTPEAEGLSGLARAFFHAGSRGLVVSHWAVPSEETVLLMARTFAELEKDPRAGLSESLRRAIAAMISSEDRPDLKHPVFWAPFVVVGDGGTPNAIKRPLNIGATKDRLKRSR